jgi:hypothetical protein
MGGQEFAVSGPAHTGEERTMGLRVARPCRTSRCVVFSVALVAIAASTLPARAEQNRAAFQVALTVLARQPAPRVAVHDVSTASPGFPPYAIVTDGVVTQAKSGDKIILREIEF